MLVRYSTGQSRTALGLSNRVIIQNQPFASKRNFVPETFQTPCWSRQLFHRAATMHGCLLLRQPLLDLLLVLCPGESMGGWVERKQQGAAIRLIEENLPRVSSSYRPSPGVNECDPQRFFSKQKPRIFFVRHQL